MALAGDVIDPNRSHKLLMEDSQCMLPDDRVDLRQPLDLSTSRDISMHKKGGFFSSRLSCCSDSSQNRDLNLSNGYPQLKKAPRPIAQTPT